MASPSNLYLLQELQHLNADVVVPRLNAAASHPPLGCTQYRNLIIAACAQVLRQGAVVDP